MLQLTPEGQRAIDDLARRHGVSADAAACMLRAVVAGQGSMAQFNHPEFGGSGQWMRGGMTMVGDMFNHALKARVDAICMELATLIEGQLRPASSGSQMQSQGGHVQASGVSLFVPGSGQGGGSWWPEELGSPSSTGAQNAVRYAYFPAPRRLAIELGGRIEVYDTKDHVITGFSQQQSGDASLTFTSQHGVIALGSLTRVDGAGGARPSPPDGEAPAATARPAAADPAGDVFTMLERLAELHAKGILSDEEFATKKAELLKRV